jgi:dihydroflavonol-4-reductase
MENVNSGSRQVLVTGGSGYLAGWVMAGLVERGFTVRTTVRDVGRASTIRAGVGEQLGPERASAIEVVSADLLSDQGWDEAMSGVEYVVHTASPLGFNPGQDLIRIASEGTQRVLLAAARAGVSRAVVTSSGVTAIGPDRAEPAVEEVWAQPSGLPARKYNDSKIIAEREAWSVAAATGLELATVLPTFMQGPMLGAPSREGSVEVIRRTLTGGLPAIPHVGWDVVDVRDIATLHILAMTDPRAANGRFLGSAGWLWWADVARILREQLPDDARKVPTRNMPDVIVKLLGLLNPQMAGLRLDLGKRVTVDSTKARTDLGWQSRPPEQTIVDTARALVAKGAID